MDGQRMTRVSRRLESLERTLGSQDWMTWRLDALRHLQGLLGLGEPSIPPRRLSTAEMEAEPWTRNLLGLIESVRAGRSA